MHAQDGGLPEPGSALGSAHLPGQRARGGMNVVRHWAAMFCAIAGLLLGAAAVQAQVRNYDSIIAAGELK
ncbi:MAG: amino acid ABC transporter substrate-binding protein, partial [Pseudomonas sp.]|nr:amino acid ABC transporter substrate-binding protein [Pseudomonas sp.]